MELKKRYLKILEELQTTGRTINLIAVSKGQSVEKIKSLVDLGHRDFGENYVQELLRKDEYLKKLGMNDIRWHFLGHLQSNKVKILVPLNPVIHSIDRLSIAEALHLEMLKRETSAELRCFLEIKTGKNKIGFDPNDLTSNIEKIKKLKTLVIQGLMVIPDPGQSESAFKQLEYCVQKLGNQTAGFLSMGMSDDYKVALQYGSTHVRIGTALFGPRG